MVSGKLDLHTNFHLFSKCTQRASSYCAVRLSRNAL